MKLRKFVAADTRQAMQIVRKSLGADAIIISNKKVPQGVELLAAVEFDGDLDADSQVELSASAPTKTYSETMATANDKVDMIEDPGLRLIKQELKALKTLLSEQLFGLSWKDYSSKQPICAALIRRLADLGIYPVVANRMIKEINIPKDINQAWQAVIDSLKTNIKFSDNLLTAPGTYALWGANGSGKTTTIAKLAARYAIEHGPEQVALITTDHFRIGAFEQIKTYGRIFNIPAVLVQSELELQKALQQFKDREYILIDTAGVQTDDERLSHQLDYFEITDNICNIFVMSAAEHFMIHEQLFTQLDRLAITDAIITKTDLACALGDVISLLFDKQLALQAISNGTNIPDDLQAATSEELLAMAIARAKTNRLEVAEEWLASVFRGVCVDA